MKKLLTFFPIHYQHWLTLIIIAIVAIVCHGLGSQFIGTMEFIHAQVNAGQYWRLLTHAFWHTNTNHLLLNLAGLALLWALHGEHYRAWNIAGLLIFCSIMSAFGVWFLSPHIDYYVGLSAALHGLFVFGAVRDVQHNRFSGWLLLAGVAVKLYLEQHQTTDTTAALINATVAYDAHIYGAIAGGGYALAYWLFSFLRQTSPDTAQSPRT